MSTLPSESHDLPPYEVRGHYCAYIRCEGNNLQRDLNLGAPCLHIQTLAHTINRRKMSYQPENPTKRSGRFHSMKGTAVESLGTLTGAKSMQQRGKEEHASGEAEFKIAKAKVYVEGSTDRETGKWDSVVGAVTGDKQRQAQGNMRGDQGQQKQQWNS
ncbi:hypothetical protein OF83DRAFT_373466 [Amylostereum chailletii]|nr:hypothetical protein OF83DRAFT_373466 [Amylostereum chailletii]